MTMSQERSSGNRIVAVCGKGGTGKTAFTAIMARILLDAERAGKMLVIDADPAMNLPNVLGMGAARTMGEIREDIITMAKRGDEDQRVKLAHMLDYMVVDALVETDKFALLAMGRTETLGCYCPVNDVLRGAIETLSKSFDTILIDGEAGLEQLNRQVMRRVDTIVAVTDATSRGMKSAALIKQIVMQDRVLQCDRIGVVVNRVQGNEGLVRQQAYETGLELFGLVPHDENIAYYDLVGKPITELATSPGVDAIRDIVQQHIFPERFS